MGGGVASVVDILLLKFWKPLAVLGLIAALAGAVWWHFNAIADLRATNDRLSLSLGACDARVTNLMEDKASDAEIDNMPDLGDVPDRWLLP